MRYFARSMMVANWPLGLTFRASANTNNATPLSKPAGIAAGDLVLIVTGLDSDPTITTNTGDTWSKDSSATQRLFWKVLNATDVAQAWNSTDPNTYALAVAYGNEGRAIESVTVRASADALASATSLMVPGFSPGALGRPRAVIAALSGGDVAVNGAIMPPAGFTERAERANPEAAFADAQRTYNYGDATFTSLAGTGGIVPSGWLVEVH